MSDFFDEVLNQEFPAGSVGAMMRRHCHELAVDLPQPESEVPEHDISADEVVQDEGSYREVRDPVTLMTGRHCRGTDCE